VLAGPLLDHLRVDEATLIALCGYHLGTGPKRSGDEVGEAVNTAIVLGMGVVLGVHAVLTFAAYA
jgi:ABC-type transporter Mla maintaining outer membrane lipid asymmetry permease subunit MlaE